MPEVIEKETALKDKRLEAMKKGREAKAAEKLEAQRKAAEEAEMNAFYERVAQTPPTEEELSEEAKRQEQLDALSERAALEPIEAGIPKSHPAADVAVGAMYDILDTYDLGSLQDMARERGIAHYAEMYKADLIEYIIRHDYTPKDPEKAETKEEIPIPPAPPLVDPRVTERNTILFTREEYAAILQATTDGRGRAEFGDLLIVVDAAGLHLQVRDGNNFYHHLIEDSPSAVELKVIG